MISKHGASDTLADESSPTEVELVLLRHGQTPGNAARRYVGCADDQPLSEIGREQARAAHGFPDVKRVYVSVLRRSQETAAIMFPNAEQVVVDDIQEMNFGIFTGRSADEMESDADYRAWVESGCENQCPGGESKAQFTNRVCAAMDAFLRAAADQGEMHVFLVAHGGTMMAFMDRYTQSERSYYEWNTPNCHGYRLHIRLDKDKLSIDSIENV